MSPVDAQSSLKSKSASTAHQDELKKLRFPRPQTAFDVDIESLDEQPWRNRNVDLLDYFNYGFNEQTWMVTVSLLRRHCISFNLFPHSNTARNSCVCVPRKDRALHRQRWRNLCLQSSVAL